MSEKTKRPHVKHTEHPTVQLMIKKKDGKLFAKPVKTYMTIMSQTLTPDDIEQLHAGRHKWIDTEISAMEAMIIDELHEALHDKDARMKVLDRMGKLEAPKESAAPATSAASDGSLLDALMSEALDAEIMEAIEGTTEEPEEAPKTPQNDPIPPNMEDIPPEPLD